MQKKIVFIHGSPRKNGNTRVVSNIAAQAAQDKEADVVEIDATQLGFDIPGCAGCMQCHPSDVFACVVGDQLALTVATLTEYDAIVVATPTYWMSYTAQIKMFIDRMGSLLKFNRTGDVRTPLAGKVLALLATGNEALENNLDLVEHQLKNVADILSCRFNSCLFPNIPIEAGAIKNDPYALQKAKEFGQWLASSN